MSYIDLTSPTYIPFPVEQVGTGKVYRSPMPRCHELNHFKTHCKITKIVQLCFDYEFGSYDIGSYGKREMQKKYKEMQFEVIQFPIKDFGVPKSKNKTRMFVDQLIGFLKEGKNILIHCVGGNGRTGLLLACLARKIFGFEGSGAIQWVRKYVPHAVETEIQEKFVDAYLEDDEEVVECRDLFYDGKEKSSSHSLDNRSGSDEKLRWESESYGSFSEIPIHSPKQANDHSTARGIIDDQNSQKDYVSIPLNGPPSQQDHYRYKEDKVSSGCCPEFCIII